MAEAPALPTMDEDKLKAFGASLYDTFLQYERDRKPAEEQWLRNMRQRKGLYDPEVKIPKDMSRAYPKLTDFTIVSTIARLMQMLFPQTEENFQVTASPMPDLPEEDLQQVLDALVAEQAQAQQVPPDQVILDTPAIEKAILALAKQKAERMHLKVRDDLAEMEYVTLARKVVQSGATYNVGLLKGPMHRELDKRTWSRDPNTGQYKAATTKAYKPLYEFLRVWNWYPDMSAETLESQDGQFERHVMTRAQLKALADRADFMGARIEKWLEEHATGNYRARWWETQLRGEPKSDRRATMVEGRKYEVISYWGDVSGHDLAAAGLAITAGRLKDMFHANVWMLDGWVIKVVLAPLGEAVPYYHPFVFEEDDFSLLGNGLCDKLRDSQLTLCAIHRAAEDNLGVIGPMVELNTDMLTPGQSMAIEKHKTWFREGEGQSAGIPAVRNISIDSHIGELLAFQKVVMEMAGKESGLPAASMGDVSGGGSEALRTQGNASMFLGAAALPIRDTVRNFDRFTISVITGLVKWNNKFAPDTSRDGDTDVIARGSTSLIAKEVLGASLDAFRQTVTEDEAPHIKTRALLAARAKARDIPADEILEDEDVANASIQRNAEAQAAAAQAQQSLVEAQVRDYVAKAIASIAKANKDDASVEHDAAALVAQVLESMQKNDNKDAETRVKAATALHAIQNPAPAKAGAA